MLRSREQNLDYRQEEVSLIMDRWKSAESCALVGVGSVGKSNLLQHLGSAKIQAKYMKLTNTNSFKAILIDPGMLSPLPSTDQADDDQLRCWAAYELMLHRLYMAFYQANNLSDADKQGLHSAYLRLQDGSNPLFAFMGLRYLELGLDIVLSKGIQIVFMFDEFEMMLNNLPVKFFLTLRGLRDGSKQQMSYLTFTRSPLAATVANLEINPLDLEEFTELFTDNTFYIGPYQDRDARQMIDILAQRNQQQDVEEHIKTFLIWSTGGFAGLLRAAFRIWPQLGGDNLTPTEIVGKSEEMARKLVKTEPVQAECNTIWQSLSIQEQYILNVAAGIEKYKATNETAIAAALLKKKRLLNLDKDNPSELIITPLLLLYYIQGLSAYGASG